MFEIKDWVYGKNRQYETIFSENVDWSIPVISWTTTNNGINFYTKDQLWDNEVFEDEITINTRWDAWKAFYHSWKFALANNILVLKLKGLNKFHKLYLATCFSKLRYGGYNNYPTINSLKEDLIYLPTLSNLELAYEYMENYIKEIEAYLKATGLSNYNLTKDEVESLKTINMGGGRKYRLDELFEKLDLKFLKKEFNKEKDISKEQTKEFNIPLVNAKAWNNGIMYYWREQDFETAELTLDIVNDWAISTWMVYPQIQKTWVLYNAYLIKPKFKHNRNLLLYFAWIVQKAIQAKFSYENKAWWNKVKEEEIILPVDSDNQINYPLIETYIKATQKLVIKDLVDKVNEKLETYKNVI